MMRGRRGRTTRSAVLATAGLLALASTASAAVASPRTATPPPGTAVEIAELVHAAPSITQVPTQSYPSISAEASDSATREFPATSHGCLSANGCVFGDTTSPQTIVLFGDSHAQMWLSAVDPAAEALHYRVVLLYLGGCPAASVDVWNPLPLVGAPVGYYAECNRFRTAAIKAINHLHPALVLLSNRTSMVQSGAGSYFTDAQWKNGVRATIDQLRRPKTKVAVIGDITYFNEPLPECLAANPTAVQQCSTANPNTASHGHEAAERTEALLLGAAFINPLSWLCTSTCSPVIGSFLAYLNNAHLDATYVTFLSNVMYAALQKVLAPQ
jgi:SGNH domain (fused to AT3 domains)